jgi:glycosidase
VREVWDAPGEVSEGALRLRFSDNHDQLRTTGASGLPAALAASAVMFTLDGAPLLYNGMEVGDGTEVGRARPVRTRTIAWEMAERRPRVAPYYRALATHAARTGIHAWCGAAGCTMATNSGY